MILITQGIEARLEMEVGAEATIEQKSWCVRHCVNYGTKSSSPDMPNDEVAKFDTMQGIAWNVNLEWGDT